MVEHEVGRRGAQLQQGELRVMIGRTIAFKFGVDVDGVIMRAADQAAGDKDVVELLGIALEHVAVAFLSRQQRVEVGQHAALRRIGQQGLEILEIEAVEVAQHRHVERRVVGQMLLDIGLHPFGLGDARGLAAGDRRLVVAPERLAAAARGEVDIDRGDRFAREAELRGERVAAAAIGGAGDQFRAALDIGHAIDIVEEAVADIAARLAAGAARFGRGDFDIGVAHAGFGVDGVDQPLGGDGPRQVAAGARAVGVLHFLYRDDVGRVEAVDDIVGQYVELVVARIEILQIIGGEREMIAVARQAGRFPRQRHVAGDRHGFGHHHFIIVEAVVEHAGDAAQLVADRIIGGEAGEHRAVIVDLDLFGIIVDRAVGIGRYGDAAAVVQARRPRAV